jgi:hypothetical protein
MSKVQYVGKIQRPGRTPENADLVIEKRADITSEERAAGVQWVNPDYEEYNVKRYGAMGDYVPATSTGTDDTAAIQLALDVATLSGSTGRGRSVYMPAGNYLVSDDLTVANATVLYGDGRQMTTLWCDTGFTGYVITDKGNASKIFLRDFAIRGQDESGLDALVRLGYGTSPFAQAGLENLFLSCGTAVITGCTCVDIIGNVATLTEIETQYGENGFREGSGSTAVTYTRCYTLGSTVYDFYVNTAAIMINCEVEAPGANSRIYVLRDLVISGLIYSQSNSGVTNAQAIEIDANANFFNMTGFAHYDGGGASTLTARVTDNRTNFPTNWMDTGLTQERLGFVGPNIHIEDGHYLLDHKRQVFKFRLENNAGTLRHRITSIGGTSASNYADRITGAVATFTNTPTGTDSTTAFAGGAKIGSASTNAIYFNTEAQDEDQFSLYPKIVYNTSGTDLHINPSIQSININGTTRAWATVFFYNATTGANYNLTSLPSGDIIDFIVEGYIN